MANSDGDGVPAPVTPGEGVELVDAVQLVDVVVDTDAARAGREVRARFDVGSRAAGFVGDESADADALAAFVDDVVRPPATTTAS